MGLDQEGELSNKRYKIRLSIIYRKLLEQAKKQMKNSLWSLLADRGRMFPLIVKQVSEVNLDNASSADIGTLIKYFSYRNKSMKDIIKTIKFVEFLR